MKSLVAIVKDGSMTGIEAAAARRATERLIREGGGRDVVWLERGSTVRDISDLGDHDIVIIMNGIAFMTREGLDAFGRIAACREEERMIVPVSNESHNEAQRRSPPFLYQTLTVFKWAAEEIYRERGDEVTDASAVDGFCYVLKRGQLQELPKDADLAEVPELAGQHGMRFGIAQGIYVHRYGQVYESARDDLLAFVPPGATEILDLGCAKGLAGERLKQRQQCVVTGVEIDAALASRARQRLDQVIEGDIASLIGANRLGLYDCVLCGDILEHLDDVWGVVEGLKAHLRTGGLLIASVPNVSNWAILYDLLIGRWDYVPFSILSGTHIRFFTKETAEELFRSAGYEIKNLNLQTLEIPPRGEAFLNELKRVFPEANEDEMRASEILIVATPASSGKEVV